LEPQPHSLITKLLKKTQPPRKETKEYPAKNTAQSPDFENSRMKCRDKTNKSLKRKNRGDKNPCAKRERYEGKDMNGASMKDLKITDTQESAG
jgi:hypothetical protein